MPKYGYFVFRDKVKFFELQVQEQFLWFKYWSSVEKSLDKEPLEKIKTHLENENK